MPGGGDFRNAKCLASFSMMPEIIPEVKFLSFSYYASRHGWNPSDRHFGAAKHKCNAWMIKTASVDPTVMPDVPRLLTLMNEMKNTTAIDMRGIQLPGVFGAKFDAAIKVGDCCSFCQGAQQGTLFARIYPSTAFGHVATISRARLLSGADAAAACKPVAATDERQGAPKRRKKKKKTRRKSRLIELRRRVKNRNKV